MTSNRILSSNRSELLKTILLIVCLCAVFLAIELYLQQYVLIKIAAEIAVVVCLGSIVIKSQFYSTNREDSGKRAIECAFDRLPDGALLIASDNRIISVNGIAKKYLSEITDTASDDRETCKIPPAIRELAQGCFESKKNDSIEITTQKSKQRFLKVVGIPLEVDVSGEDCVLITISDITEAKDAEKRQRDIISNFSHEMKTPIAAIRISAETLVNGAKNDPIVSDKFLDNIIDECDRLSFLIENIIRIARFDSGSIVVSRQSANIKSIIRNALRTLQPQIERKSMQVNVDVPQDLTFSVDEYYLVTAIRNLVDNAIKYSNPNALVNIRAAAQEGSLVISVEDHGIGIPQGESEYIFERFYRVDKARTYQVGGTGLGLAIVKRIVQLHNGSVMVDSVLGQGSIFTVRIPGESQ